MAALVNSDPELIVLGKRWFEDCLAVPADSFRPYVYIGEQHVSRQGAIVAYWSNKIDLPKQSFKVVVLKGRAKKKYENHDVYYGVLSLRVCKSTDLKYKIQGLIDACIVGGK